MPERSKRQVKLPTRYQDADEIWEQMTRVEKQTVHRIYRPLRRRDVTKELAMKDVYLYWPDDDRWYRAHVEKIFFQTSSALVHYPDDDTYEEINLKQLIKDKHIAFIETKGKSMKLRQGEKPVDDDGTAIYFEADDEPESSEDIGSDDWVNESDLDDEDDDDDELSEGAEEVDMEEAMHEKSRKASKHGMTLAEQARRSQAKSRPVKKDTKASSQDDSGPPPPPGLQPLKSKQQHSTSTGGGALPSKRVSAASSSIARAGSLTSNNKGLSKQISGASILSRGSGQLVTSDEEMRKKAKDQLIAALTLAIEEVNKRGQDERCVDGKAPDAQMAKEVGAKIESELFDLQRELSSLYKSKFRSLIFNLKDPNNELRLRVLLGDIAPSQLVRMEATDMASASMVAWRQKKAEEQAKSKFLSTEAAAKFSTAAAAQLAETSVIDKLVPNIDIPSAQILEAEAITSMAAEEEGHATRAWSGSLSPSQQDLGKRNLSNTLLSSGAASLPVEAGLMRLEVQAVKSAATLVPATAQRVTLNQRPAALTEGMVQASSIEPASFDQDEDYFVSTYEERSGMKVRYEERSGDYNDDVEHLMPLLGSSRDILSTSRAFKSGDEIWSGSIGGQIDHGVVSSLCCSFLCGLGDIQAMLSGSSALEVKGTIKTAALEIFLEDLQKKSKTRIATLGLIRSSLGALEGMGRVFSDLVSVYSSSAKAGVCHPLPGLEGYLLSSSSLARRLIKTACLTLPSQSNQLLDSLGKDIGSNELLLVIVHKRDFVPPRITKTAPPPAASSASVRPFDPRSRNQPEEATQRPYDPRSRTAPSSVTLPPVQPSAPPASVPAAPVMSLSGLGALAAALGVVKPDVKPPSPPRPTVMPSFDLSALGALAQAVGVKADLPPPPPPPPFPSVPFNPSPMTRSAPHGPYSEDYDREFINAMMMYQGRLG